MRNCLEHHQKTTGPRASGKAGGRNGCRLQGRTRCFSSQRRSAARRRAAPSHDGRARSPGRFASRGQLNVVLVFHLGGVDFLNADLESEQLPFQIGFTAPFTGRGHRCSLSRRMADGRWRENRQRKVRTPQGSMPCRTRGRRRRKPGATESVTENKPPVRFARNGLARVKRRGKSSPPGAQATGHEKPHAVQDRTESGPPARHSKERGSRVVVAPGGINSAGRA